MKQVNIWLTDERYELLVKEAGKRMAQTGKLIKVSTLATTLLNPALDTLNGNKPTEKPSQDNIPDKSPQTVSTNSKESKLAQDFAKLDF